MENPNKWPDLLQQYRTSKHNSTNYRPFFLHRGHSPRLPMDILFGTFNQKRFQNHDVYAYDLNKTLKYTYNYVENTLKANQDFIKNLID